MMKFLDVLRSPKKAEADRVTCGECPVNMACVLEEGGTGWTWNCCGSTSVRIEGLILSIDCARHNFEQNTEAKSWDKCPMCSGSIMEVVERARHEGTDPNRYVLTAHAKIPLAERLKVWKETHVAAVARLEAEKERA